MKTGFLITARLKSSRLPEKILLDLNGKCIIDRIIERCLSLKDIDDVVLCTSTNPQDARLVAHAENYGILYFLGSEDDVMERLLSAANKFGFDNFIGITADNPLFCTQTALEQIMLGRNDNYDFITVKNLPIGCATYFVNVKALQIAQYMKNLSDTEIWGPFINRPDFFNTCEIAVTNSPYKEEKRLTCDYPEDYLLFQNIFSHFSPDSIPDIKDVFNVLLNKPQLWNINEMHEQRMLSHEILEEINAQFIKQIPRGRLLAKQLNKQLFPGKTLINIEL